LGMGCTPLL